MTRKEIEAEYTVENDVIRSPGKFEGDAVYVPYFWDAFLNGSADEDDGDVLTFIVDADDAAMFTGLLEIGQRVRLIEDEQGFVTEL